MDDDRLAWIYSATNPTELRERYEVWAAEYDADLDAMLWLAPQAGAARCHAWAPADARILDAGCGTGLVGAALHALGQHTVVGFDLSPAMLARSADRGVYAELVEGSLLAPLPFAAGLFDAVVSVGVFTYGHVGPEALAGLAGVVRTGGHVTITFRDDAIGPLGYAAEIDRLEQAGVWRLVERTAPAPLIEEEGVGADMCVWTWEVLR